MSREIKVGLLVLAALVVLAGGIFMIGEKSNLFTQKNDYFVRQRSVAGLASGSPVQLNGVNVGDVTSIVLPEDVAVQELTVWVAINRDYESRIRSDSLARIKTLGLLGDKYVEISSGSPGAEIIPSGGEIRAAPATDVDELLASGGDAVENVVAISYSLRSILARMEAGEGILGQLTTDNEAGERAKEAILAALESLQGIAHEIETGDGSLSSLIHDGTLADRMTASIDRFEAILAKVETGEGALPALLNDAETGEQLKGTIADLGATVTSLSELVAEIREGEGLLARLLLDEEYGRKVGSSLEELLDNLNDLSGKLERGEGSVGKLLDDPSVYEAINDVIVGINESKLLRWLIRNRQKSGIKVRYQEERQHLEEEGAGDGATGRP